MTNATTRQVGGSHYASLAIQPMEYALKNDLNYAQANAVKYVTRYKSKGGIEDLRKAIHCIELLIEHELEAVECDKQGEIDFGEMAFKHGFSHCRHNSAGGGGGYQGSGSRNLIRANGKVIGDYDPSAINIVGHSSNAEMDTVEPSGKTSRIDIIGQNGNGAEHYEWDLNATIDVVIVENGCFRQAGQYVKTSAPDGRYIRQDNGLYRLAEGWQ